MLSFGAILNALGRRMRQLIVEEAPGQLTSSNSSANTSSFRSPEDSRPPVSPDCEEVPIDDKFVSKLRGIDSQIRHRPPPSSSEHPVSEDKIHIGFAGFSDSGKSSLIRSILGIPNARAAAVGEATNRRRSFRKSRSVHFSECINPNLIPWHFRNLSTIVLWEISYPFDPSIHKPQVNIKRREEKLRQFFRENNLDKFCILFVCADAKEHLCSEDVTFCRIAREYGRKVVFLATKSDASLRAFCPGTLPSPQEREAHLQRERSIFSSRLSVTAADCLEVQLFFVSSRVLPGLMRESKEEGLAVLRDIEKLPVRAMQANEEDDYGRRNTMGEGGMSARGTATSAPPEQSLKPPPDPEDVENNWGHFLLDEKGLLQFIIKFIDDFETLKDRE